MRREYVFAAAGALACWAGSAAAQSAGGFTYPDAPKGSVTDDYHGTKVPDPYRWLEDPDSPESRAWIEAENAVTFGFLEGIPQRPKIKERLTRLWDYEKYGLPAKEGGKYFWTYNTGLQNQSALFVADSLDATPRLLLDPNTLSKDGTVALAGTAVSDDGKYLAYGTAEAGSDWNVWRVRDVGTGQDLGDEVRWVKFSGASWTKDNRGFLYTRYDEPKPGQELTGANYYPKVYFHFAGMPQDRDVLVYERPDEKEWGFGAGVTEDGRYLVMYVSQGTDPKNRVFVRDLHAKPIGAQRSAADAEIRAIEELVKGAREAGSQPGADAAAAEKTVSDLKAKRTSLAAGQGNSAHGFVELLNDFDASYEVVGNEGTRFWFNTNLDAPRGKVIGIDLANPARHMWTEVIPQAEETLQGVNLVGDRFFCSYLKDARTQVKVFDLNGTLVREVEFPGLGTAGGFGGKREYQETFYSFTAYTTPPTIYRYDVKTGESTVFKAPKVGFDPSAYVTEQKFYTSKDGTRVPMFITHRKGAVPDGNNPTLLYGYGGFNISLTPSFSPATAVWLEMGGVYAVANLRGGGEYGEDWHQAGTKGRKQNVFDDFIAGAEFLIREKYTRPEKLAIQGGSNGGLLVGACMAQRPELFGACLPAVGVMDMLRFHLFTIGWAWKSDYGSSETPEEFAALHAYSPYHNLKPGVAYPATMITTADHDDRVVPAHSFKFAAALQAAQAGANPTLIRIDVRAGHGAGKPTTKRIEEVADLWSFLVKTLGMEPGL